MFRSKWIKSAASYSKRFRRCRRSHFQLELLEPRTLLSVNFGPPTNYSTFSTGNEITAADLNGDGRLDLLTVDGNFGSPTGHGFIGVQLGNGDGTFQTWIGNYTGYQPLRLAVADFNLDGKPDVATANEATDAQGNGLVSILLGNGVGGFNGETDYLGNVLGGGSLSIATGDFNGDGKPDIVDGTLFTPTVSVILGNGDGTFQAPHDFSFGPSGGQPISIAVGDWNGDGKLDLAVALNDSSVDPRNAVGIMLGNGDGTFTVSGIYSVGEYPRTVAMGDFNGDGKVDLATSNQNDDTYSILLGDGDGTFQPALSYSLGTRPFALAAADFNGNGKLDLVTADIDSHSVGVLLGNGDGTFQSPQTFSVGSGYPGYVCAGDFNGDGSPDVATDNGGSVSVLLQIPGNLPPTAIAGGPYSIQEGASLNLDASASSDPEGDPLTYSWDVNGDGVFGDATGVKPTLTWAQLQALGIDDGPTTWNVKVRVSDGFNPPVTSAAATLSLSNTAPTAALSNNGPVDEGSPVTISFSSQADPSSADTAAGFHYSYALSPAGLANSYASATDGTSESFSFDDGPSSPTVYARIFDKDDGYNDYNTVVTVNNAPPTANVSGPVDGVPYQPRTFTFTATDPSSADQAAGFTYSIIWGDGTPAQTIAPSAGNGVGVTVDHVYVTTGTYPIQVTASDKDGGTSAAAAQMISVKASAQQGGTFAIGGDANNDAYVITATTTAGKFTWSMNGGPVTTTSSSQVALYGGPQTDSVTISGTSGSDTFTITGSTVNVAGVTISGANLQSWNVKGLGGNDLFNVTGTGLPLAVDGGTGTNTLGGPDQTTAWTISASNSGTMGATSFANMANLTSGSGVDTFAFQGSGSISGNLNGGGGADTLDLSGSSSTVTVNLATRKATRISGTWSNLMAFIGNGGSTLTGPNAATTWAVTGPDSGTVGNTSFSGFANLNGGSGNDAFAFQGSGSVSGNVNGGSGTDTLDLSGSASTATVNMASKTATGIGGTWSSLMAFIGNSGSTLIGPNATTSWSVTGSSSGTVGSSPFSSFANLTGGTGNDTFTIGTTGGVTGLIDGGAGTNTLVGSSQTTTWTISGSNSGMMGSISFADMANLKGGTGSDTFAFQGGGSVSGTVNGGGGTDTLDLSDSASTATVNLASKTATGIGGTWSSLVAFVGNNGSTLVGPNPATTWTLSAVGSGTAGTTAFHGFANVTGGTGNDKFTVATGAGVSGLIDGGTGTNTLDFSTYSSSGVIVDLPLGGATATGGGIAHIQNVNGSSVGGDILVGDASPNILRVYAGQNILIGGMGADTLYAGSSLGGDILIGGTTAYDSNIAALQTILATWATSTPSTYGAVAATISSPSFADPLNASTVFDDGSIDVLVGVSGSVNDWFFAHTSGSNLDQVKNRDAGEIVTSI
jgi:hypothetical protein